MPTYEMLWDCDYCGTRKLLGKTHRFCPGCGAPQDPTKRYFPPDDEKVAVEDHEYVGADRMCGACGSAMSAKAAHCTQCGAPMEGAAEVVRIRDTPEPRGDVVGAAPQERKKGGKGCLLAGAAAAVLIVIGLLVSLLWRKEVDARVTGNAWERSIAVERLAARHESEWCDALPRDARNVSRHREERDRRRVPDGQDCRTKKVDQGDGTFREDQECTPRFREEPVYDMRCDYTVDRWGVDRTVKAEGQGLSPEPTWPAMSLRAGGCVGCEREGQRSERYRVTLQSPDGKRFSCDFDEATWRKFSKGSHWKAKVGVVTGAAACGSLEPR